MTYDEWVARFRPIKNPAQDHGFDQTMFETYGADLEKVQAADENFVWTLMDNSDTVVAGYHVINRLGYFITEEPYDDPVREVQFNG